LLANLDKYRGDLDEVRERDTNPGLPEVVDTSSCERLLRTKPKSPRAMLGLPSLGHD
jgi:hypothetical protein